MCDGLAVVALGGDLDITGTADAGSAIAAVEVRGQIAIPGRPTLDFTGCSSPAALLIVQKPVGGSGGDVLPRTPLAQVQRLPTLTAMGDAFSVHVNVDAGVASLGCKSEMADMRRPAVRLMLRGAVVRVTVAKVPASDRGLPADARAGFPARMLHGRMRR